MSEEKAPTHREPHPDASPRRRTPEDPLRALTAFAGESPEIPLEKLDVDALKVVHRLRSYGHQAYLVGGCVRDLILGLQPKDFDVATSAHPGEIRAIFRNCRLIGRRFRLAHVYFRGGKVIETATFRANPHEDLPPEQRGSDLLITRDNVFGTAEEDARRRDFTINGLFYDVVLGRVLDYVGGKSDLERRLIRTIGDPDVRMREDPVRLLRAVRFAAKLGMEIEEATWEAMRKNAAELARCAPPRVLEEIFRLLRSGQSRRCFELLRDVGALQILLPPLAHWLETSTREEGEALFRSLDLLDEMVRRGPLPEDSVLLSILLLHHSQRQLVKQAQAPEAASPAAGPAELSTEPAAQVVAEEAIKEELGGEEPSEVEELEAIERAADEAAPLPEVPEEEEALADEEAALPDENGAAETPPVPWSLSVSAENVEELLAELVRNARLPRRIAERARLILHAQRVLSGIRKRRSSPMKFVRQPYFPDALLVFELFAKASGKCLEELERWRSRYAQVLGEQREQGREIADPSAAILAREIESEQAAAPAAPAEAAPPEEPEGAAGRRRKRRRGKRERKSLENEAAAAVASAEVEERVPTGAERLPPPGPADFMPF